MEAKTRFGEPIVVGRRYLFATVHSSSGVARLKVTGIVDKDAVLVDEHGWTATRWACNALCEVE